MAEARAIRVCLLVLALSAVLGCGSGPGQDAEAHRASVMSGLLASSSLSAEQASTFQVHVDNPWAVAYDPADPPGCAPGGGWGAPEGAPIPERPCMAYVLHRRKARWVVLATGWPGTFVPPHNAPKELGAPSALQYLGGG